LVAAWSMGFLGAMYTGSMPLGRCYSQVWSGPAAHSPILGVLGGLYVDACHPGVRVFLELFGLSCDAASRLCVPITCLWPVFGQGVCLSCVLGVRCTPLGFICMVFGSGFPYKLDHNFSRKLNTLKGSSPAFSKNGAKK
jgi:hypothetical protein